MVAVSEYFGEFFIVIVNIFFITDQKHTKRNHFHDAFV